MALSRAYAPSPRPNSNQISNKMFKSVSKGLFLCLHDTVLLDTSQLNMEVFHLDQCMQEKMEKHPFSQY